MPPPDLSPAPQVSQPITTPVAPSSPLMPKSKVWSNPSWRRGGLVALVLIGLVAAFLIGRAGERVVVRRPAAPPVTLPPQATVLNQCVAGLGKQYVIPKDIPNGPIYDVLNSKVIAVEYNYRAIDLYANPDLLSNTVVPFTKQYQIDHFTTSIGAITASSLQAAQDVPIHLIIYVVPKAEAASIKC